MIQSSNLDEHLSRDRSEKDAIDARNTMMQSVVSDTLSKHRSLGHEAQAAMVLRAILARGYAFYYVGGASILDAGSARPWDHLPADQRATKLALV